ncbi:cupin domain-containing protein [bacterium]|nr:cupin domain-containing protein [bacterium]
MASKRVKATSIVEIDNDRVIVTRWQFEPGAETGWHRHERDYVVVPLTDGQLLLESKDGESKATLQSGKPYSRSLGVEHNTVNNNDFDFAFVEIELK